MTPRPEIRKALITLGWSHSQFATRVGWSEGMVRHWMSGKFVIPPDVEAWLLRRAQSLRDDPPPRRDQ